MLKRILEFFSGPNVERENINLLVDKRGIATSKDLQLAATVLLVETAQIDKNIDQKEGAAVVQALVQQLGITEDETITDLVQAAVAAGQDDDGNRIDDFIECLNQNFTDEQREIVLSMVWQVILADDEITKHEERLAKRFRNQLRLTDEQGERARSRAEENVKRL